MNDAPSLRAASPPSCPALCRASTSLRRSNKQDVDGRDKPGHDERESPIAPLVLRAVRVRQLAVYSRNLLSTAPGTGCDLSRPFASRVTQTLFSEHSTQVSPLRSNRCSTSKLERPKAIVLSTVTSSPNRVGLRKRARVRTSGKPLNSKSLNI